MGGLVIYAHDPALFIQPHLRPFIRHYEYLKRYGQMPRYEAMPKRWALACEAWDNACSEFEEKMIELERAKAGR